MMFYAYTPDAQGNEPLGTSGKVIRWDLKTDRGFIRYARKMLGPKAVCYRVMGDRFYDPGSFTLIAKEGAPA